MSKNEVCYYSGLEPLKAVLKYEKIIDSLQAALPNHDIQGYFKRKSTLLAEANHIAIAWNGLPNKDKGSVIGLITARKYSAHKEQPEFIHISTLHIAEEKQRSILLKKLIAKIYLGISQQKKDNLPTWTAIKTFHPSVYNALLRLNQICGSGVWLYPTLDSNFPEDEEKIVERVASQIATRLEPDCIFDSTLGVIRGGGGAIGGSFWSTKPRSSHSKINLFFDERLDAKDRMLCILKLDGERGKASAMKLLTRWNS